MVLKMIATAALLLATATACGGSTDSSPTPGKYDQTWSKSYGATSCGEWLNKMSPQQRFAGAADMLSGARNKGDGGTGVPEDQLIDEFAQDVDTACTGPVSSLAEAGARAYLANRSHYRP